jgi:predicted HD superfamily hydrolase involved in NAD metabolism
MSVYDVPLEEELVAALKKNLPEKTLRHALSVADWIPTVARAAGVERRPAVTAALLHDLCKAMKPEELLERARYYGIELRQPQLEKPALLHGPVAAETARREFGLDDEEIYDAVYFHTTGRPDWHRLGLALYVADFSEPLRSYPEAAEARRILETQGFEAALCKVAEVRLSIVRTKPMIDPLTEAFHSWLHRADAGLCA